MVRQRLNVASGGTALGDALHDRRDVQPFGISPLLPPSQVVDAWHFYVGDPRRRRGHADERGPGHPSLLGPGRGAGDSDRAEHEHHGIHTQLHDVGKTTAGKIHQRVGFVGTVEFSCAVGGRAHPVTPDDVLRGLSIHLRFGELTGVGDHTPVGVGVMTLQDVAL